MADTDDKLDIFPIIITTNVVNPLYKIDQRQLALLIFSGSKKK